MKEPFTSHSEAETIAFGRDFAQGLKPGQVVALQGELGAGKTQLVKGIAAGWGVEQKQVHSPTFSLINEYDGRIPIYHFDCYRMESVREAIEIGAEDYFYRHGLCLIEWPERIVPILPDETIWVELEILDAQKRQFSMKQKSS